MSEVERLSESLRKVLMRRKNTHATSYTMGIAENEVGFYLYTKNPNGKKFTIVVAEDDEPLTHQTAEERDVPR